MTTRRLWCHSLKTQAEVRLTSIVLLSKGAGFGEPTAIQLAPSRQRTSAATLSCVRELLLRPSQSVTRLACCHLPTSRQQKALASHADHSSHTSSTVEGSGSFGVLPSSSERTQGVQGIVKGFFFFRGSVAVKDFSSTLSHGLFSFRDSLR